MLTYGFIDIIADAVYDSLGIPDDIYLTFDKDSVREFNKKYLYDTSYIDDLVDAELANYDTSDNIPADIEDIKDSAVDTVCQKIEANIDKYSDYQHQLVLDAYHDIISAIRNVLGIIDVDVEYEPADSSVGIYDEERSIVVTLSNGATISFDVNFDESDI